MKIFKLIAIWGAGLLITLLAAKYQRTTGPTYPFSTTVHLNEREYELEFIRSGSITKDAEITMEIGDPNVAATLIFRKFPTNDSYQSIEFNRNDGQLIAALPKQPMAGKLQYYVEFLDGDKKIRIPNQVIRFKGDVPYGVLIPHILFMFLTMFLSNVSGLLSTFGLKQFKPVALFTFWALLLGGMILGPVVQKFAFNEYWAGIPFGWDLTDNKTLIAFLFWVVAILANRKTPSRIWVIVASIVTLIIFAIPHSMFGSELNPETGEIIQGMINLKLFF